MKLGYVIIYVPSVLEAVDFYENAFDLKRRFVHEEGDYGEIDCGDIALSFATHELGEQVIPVPYTRATPDAPAPGIELTLVAEDVDAAFQRAVEAGATPVEQPHDQPWGQRVSYVRDLNGVLVSIASPMG